MIPFTEQARVYAEYHQKKEACFVHMFSLPLILLSLMILLGFVHVFIPGVLEVTLADITALGLLIYYFCLNWRLALTFTPLLIIILWIAGLFSDAGPSAFSLWSFIIIFAIGWISQFIGYFMEGKHASYRITLKQIIIEPLCLIAELYFLTGYMKELHDEVHGLETVEVDILNKT